MNKKIYIVLFIIIVLGLALWAFISSKNENTSETGPATVSVLSVSNASSPASAVLAGAKTINWQTTNYPADAGVNINLIKKISDTPIKEFTLVRTLETNAPNSGEYLWVPRSGENSNDLYIEVTCSNSYQFQSKCSLSSEPIKVN